LSRQLKAVQLALTNYALDRENPALEPAARNNLNFAIYVLAGRTMMARKLGWLKPRGTGFALGQDQFAYR
jgi:hypothetical protein